MAGISVNTNVGAMTALQNLNKINSDMETTQMRITTGLRVNSAKDDASSYAIAQTMRGDVAGYEAVRTGLGLMNATVNTALKAGEAISGLMTEMKAKAVQANQSGLDSSSKASLNSDFQALKSQIDTIVSSASFNGSNLISSGATNLTVISTVDGSSITVSAQNLSSSGLSINGLTLGTSAGAASALSSIDTAISTLNTKLAKLGLSAKSIEIQDKFVGNLVDILKEGIGTMVDADMAQESAKLQSLQIQQQLGTQALSIANSAPQSVLSLFR